MAAALAQYLTLSTCPPGWKFCVLQSNCSQMASPSSASQALTASCLDTSCCIQSWRSAAGTPSTSEELLRLPCDVLILASVTGIITAENAPELQCKAGFTAIRALRCATCTPKCVVRPKPYAFEWTCPKRWVRPVLAAQYRACL